MDPFGRSCSSRCRHHPLLIGIASSLVSGVEELHPLDGRKASSSRGTQSKRKEYLQVPEWKFLIDLYSKMKSKLCILLPTLQQENR